VNHLNRLIGHLVWADRLVLDALKRAKSVDPKTVNLYAHLLAAEHVWFTRLVNAAATVLVWPTLTVEECERLAAANAEQLSRYVDQLKPADLARGITYKNSAGAQFTSLVEDILLHVALHGAYHRGQITSALRAGGSIPNPTDYIAFIRGAATATRIEPR
jgi:uncharacterized damage-inducible protein DinB